MVLSVPILTVSFNLKCFVGDNEEGEVASDEEEEIVRRVGPHQKDWDQLGPQQKRKKGQKLFDELNRTAKKRKIEPVRMVGSLLQR